MRLFFITCIVSVGLCQVKLASTKGNTQTMTLFSQVNVVDVETGRVLSDRDVFVANKKIISIRKHDSAGIKKQKELLLIPAKGKYLVPGLIDCHTHIVYKEDLLSYLSNGVTTVFSLGQPQEILRFREEVKKGAVAGPSIYAAALIDTIPQDWEGKIYNYVVHSQSDVNMAMTRIKKQRYDLIKVYNSLTTPEFDEIMRLAKSYELPVVGHGVRQPGMEHILSKGMAMVAHGEEYLYTFFSDNLDERKIPAAVSFTKKSGAFVCPNLSTFQTILTEWGDSLRFAGLLEQAGDVQHRVSPKMLDFWMNNNHYIHREGSPLTPMYPFLQKLTYALYKSGVPLVAGTDSPIIPGCFPGYSLVKELQLLTEAGISTPDALRMATLVPGSFIDRYLLNGARTGAIKEGFAADLLLLSENPLESVQSLRKIEGVMAKGRWFTKAQLARLANK